MTDDPVRWVAGAAAAVGVALSVPSLLAPTWRQTIGDRERGELLSEQAQWSWGRIDLAGGEGLDLGGVPNPVGLAVAVLALGCGVVAVAAWLSGRRTLVALAPAGVALLVGRLLATAGERVGRDLAAAAPDGPGLSVVAGSTTAGWLETAAAAVLLVALAVMLARLVVLLRAGADPAVAPATPEEPPAGRHLEGPVVGLSDTDGR